MQTGDFTCWSRSGLMQYTAVSMDNPHSGSFAAHCGEFGGLGFLSQTAATTAGHHYQLTFWLAHNFINAGSPNQFQVSIDCTIVYNQTNLPVFGYTQYSFNFLASGPTPLQFGVREDPSWFDFDDVVVTDLGPAPSDSGWVFAARPLGDHVPAASGVHPAESSTLDLSGSVQMGSGLAETLTQIAEGQSAPGPQANDATRPLPARAMLEASAARDTVFWSLDLAAGGQWTL
jgi:hypothetical protein